MNVMGTVQLIRGNGKTCTFRENKNERIEGHPRLPRTKLTWPKGYNDGDRTWLRLPEINVLRILGSGPALVLYPNYRSNRYDRCAASSTVVYSKQPWSTDNRSKSSRSSATTAPNKILPRLYDTQWTACRLTILYLLQPTSAYAPLRAKKKAETAVESIERERDAHVEVNHCSTKNGKSEKEGIKKFHPNGQLLYKTKQSY